MKREELLALIEMARGQFRGFIVLAFGTPLLLTWKYLGSETFYQHWTGAADSAQAGTAAAAYRFVSGFLLMGVVPALVVKLVFRQRLADYGLRLGIAFRTVRSFLLCAPFLLLAAYVGSHDSTMREIYPLNKEAGASAGIFALHVALYFLFYCGWEFFFRGFMLIGLRDAFGSWNAVLVQMMASTLLHVGGPGSEAFTAIFAGLLWGMLALRTRSLLSGLMQHFLVGITVDWLICFGR